MIKDIRSTSLYREVEASFTQLRRPGSGELSDAAEIHASPDGARAVFIGTLVDRLEGTPPTRICLADLRSGDMRVLSAGPHTDRLPKFSPDGTQVAFLSDRHQPGDFQLHFIDVSTGAVRAAGRVEGGWVEYSHWSPDGARILLAVAGHGADTAAGHGAIASQVREERAASWLPQVETGQEAHRWRSAWLYDCASNRVTQIPTPGVNPWEIVWCGRDAIAAVVSAAPSEGSWYKSHLRFFEIASGRSRVLYEPQDQIGWPSASPSGQHVAIVEALCSDRWFVAGDLWLLDSQSGAKQRIDTRGIDVSHTEWRSETVLLIAGHRHWESVVATYDATSRVLTEVWSSTEVTTGGLFMSVAGIGTSGDCALIGEGFVRAPEIAVIRGGRYQRVRSVGPEDEGAHAALGSIERPAWQAPDGQTIEGWLLLPRTAGPHPLVMAIHGGPVGHWRPLWLGRRNVLVLLLLRRGYAIFLPNPRGSAGYGQAFARGVLGDMGGADTYDYLSGLDALVDRGVVDASRIGLMGVSYGGYMSSWLVTQDPRFAAAVPVSPVSNHVTQQLVSNIPEFVSLFLEDTYENLAGKYYTRSPVTYAARVRTPTLNVCGALDRCTPAVEAVQFHNALLQHGVESALLTYPEEGHGIRKFPAVIDYTARVIAWFEEHMPARKPAVQGELSGGIPVS